MSNIKGIYLIIFCVTFQLVKDATAQTVWKTWFSPPNPPLVRVRTLEQTRGPHNFAVLDFIGLVQMHSYPGEEHRVTTEDGYHLVIHRIPSSPYTNTTQKKKVVFLQHGLLASSDMWVLTGPKKDLAFLLADNGYDVWLGNLRGNTYCRSHQKLSPVHKQFWDFSQHEHALYDLRTMIDYVLQYTRKKKLTYVGHSMGSTISYILLSMRPEYNGKVKLVVNLAPVAFWNYGLTPIFSNIVKYRDWIKQFLDSNEIYDLGAQSTITTFFGKKFCNDESPAQVICATLLFLFSGVDPPQMNTTMLPHVLAHYPAGCSVKVLVHYSQNMLSRNFQFYDYGANENFLRYKQKSPPIYDLKKITAPFAIFYGNNDVLLKPENARELSNHLTNIITLQAIPYKLFTHMDFVLGIDARTFLYDGLVEIIKHF